MAESEEGGQQTGSKRSCFVVSAFGSGPEDQQRHKQVLRHLVRKVLGDRFEVVRADEIDDEGLITNQIVEHLLEDDLVVADLTSLNPNVFYEVAVRHAVRKPIVHLITAGERIPFDVANMRAVQYSLDDPDALEAAQAELDRKVRAIESTDWVAAPNPISAARDVWLLQESEQPEVRQAGDLLGAVASLRDEVRALARRVETPGPRKANSTHSLGWDEAVARTKALIARSGPMSASEIIEDLGVAEPAGEMVLSDLVDAGELFRMKDGRISDTPF
jgi:hypothetical protein